jgi:anti-sigma regulatory factor (Ser/Thr protein kinase)
MTCIPITEASQIMLAKRAATELARNLGFNETEEGKVALLVTELATNLIKHATSGQLLIHGLTQAGSNSIELLALDKGPGMENVARCLRDGYSTAGSPGTGLGAIFRTSSLADIYSVPEAGTAVLARIQAKVSSSRFQVPSQNTLDLRLSTQHSALGTLDVGAVCIPKAGEEVCGDAWAVDQRPGRWVLMVADGLGHGLGAAEAVQEAVRVFRAHAAQAPAEIIAAAHAALRATRGAAVAVTELDRTKQQVRFCGVGNIAGAILLAAGGRSMVSHNGIVGHRAVKIQEFTYPWSTDALLVMHSDGLVTHWSFDAYPGLIRRQPSLIASVLYRDFSRGRDDVTVIVAKERESLRTEYDKV